MVIDAHVHIGKAFWGDFSPEFLLSIIGENIGICSNLEAIDSYTLSEVSAWGKWYGSWTECTKEDGEPSDTE